MVAGGKHEASMCTVERAVPSWNDKGTSPVVRSAICVSPYVHRRRLISERIYFSKVSRRRAGFGVFRSIISCLSKMTIRSVQDERFSNYRHVVRTCTSFLATPPASLSSTPLPFTPVVLTRIVFLQFFRLKSSSLWWTP